MKFDKKLLIVLIFACVSLVSSMKNLRKKDQLNPDNTQESMQAPEQQYDPNEAVKAQKEADAKAKKEADAKPEKETQEETNAKAKKETTAKPEKETLKETGTTGEENMTSTGPNFFPTKSLEEEHKKMEKKSHEPAEGVSTGKVVPPGFDGNKDAHLQKTTQVAGESKDINPTETEVKEKKNVKLPNPEVVQEKNEHNPSKKAEIKEDEDSEDE